MRTAAHRRARIEAIVAAIIPILGIAALHRLGDSAGAQIEWSDPIGWIQATDADDVIVATLRALGLGVCQWLALSTIAHACTAIARVRLEIRLPAAFAPSIPRWMADRIVAGAIAVSTIAAPAAHAATGPPPTISTDPIEVRAGAAAASGAVSQIDPGFPPVIARSRQVDVEHSASRVEIQRGDTLWELAGRRMSATLNRRPTANEIAVYWRQVVAANRATLRSGDPDVIHPGEIIVLP